MLGQKIATQVMLLKNSISSYKIPKIQWKKNKNIWTPNQEEIILEEILIYVDYQI